MTRLTPTLQRITAARLALALALPGSGSGLRGVQERIFDRLLPAPPDNNITVIDIGAEDETGQPWTRAATARLVNQIHGITFSQKDILEAFAPVGGGFP